MSVLRELPAVRTLLRLLLNPGWAPFAVVLLHVVLAEFGLNHRFDHLLHFLGGASMAYFLHGILLWLAARISLSPKWISYLIAFTGACTVAVFWEFGEAASDHWLGTHVQQSLTETMLDLFYGVLGAILMICLLATAKVIRK